MMGAAFMPDSAISPDEMVSHDSSSSIEALKNWGKKMLLNTPGSFDTVQLLKKKISGFVK